MNSLSTLVSSSFRTWRLALQGKNFRIEIILSLASLLACGWVAPRIFQYIENRNGIVLNDWLLAWLPPVTLSVPIFTLLYLLVGLCILALLTKPYYFLMALQAYTGLTLLRFITLLLTPLDPPVNMLPLRDPFVEYFFYQETITKDLFFSGHTSILVLLGLCLPYKKLRTVTLTGAGLIGIMLLFQHIHYTIDVFAAPVFAILVYAGVRRAHVRRGRLT